MRPLTLHMTWPCYEWQVEATKAFYDGIKKDVRFFVWVVSRQNGKTALLEAICIRQAAQGQTIAYFAPSYDRSEEVYNEACEALTDLIECGLVVNKATKAGWVIRFTADLTRAMARAMGDPAWATKRPGALHFKSLGNPEHLRGQTLDGAVVDETGLVPGRVFRKIVRPMLTAKDGWCVFSGTPPEDDECPDPRFFRGLADTAKSDDPNWFYIHRDYRAHPSKRVVSTIERERLRMPADEFDREYMATFPDEEEFRLPPLRLWGPSTHQADRTLPALPPGGCAISCGIDLADNERDIGDHAAVVTWAIAPGGYVYILAAEYYRNPSEVLDALYRHKEMYEFEKVMVQSSAFDKGFKHTILAAESSRGHIPVETTGLGGASKRRRIMTMEPLARAGKFFVHEDLAEFLREWEQFPDGLQNPRVKRHTMSHHYDMLDACAPLTQDARGLSTWKGGNPSGKSTMTAALRALRASRRGGNAGKYYQVR